MLKIIEKAVKWIEKHKIFTVIIVIAGFIIPLIIIRILFLIPSPNEFFRSDLNEGDLLGYFAAFEALFGTLFLSVTALSQTQRDKEDSDFYRNADTKRPFFIIDKITRKIDTKSKYEPIIPLEHGSYRITSPKGKEVKICLKNIGDGIAHKYSIKSGNIESSYMGSKSVLVNSEISITYKINLADYPKGKDQFIDTVAIEYSNIIGFRYKQIVIITRNRLQEPSGQIDGTNLMDYVDVEELKIFPIEAQIPLRSPKRLRES